jgi:THO complex subunit 4
MSTKLDQSLDQILSSRRQSTRRGTRRRSGAAGKATMTSAPVGGVKKTTRTTKTTGKGVPSGQSAAAMESKIIVSGLVGLRLNSFPVDTY